MSMSAEQRAILSQKMKALRRKQLEQGTVELNHGLLVPWAAGKCSDCGTTLASAYDVQTHLCVPSARSKTRAIDLAYGWGDTKR